MLAIELAGQQHERMGMWVKLALATAFLISGCAGNTGPGDRGELQVGLSQQVDSIINQDLPIPLSIIESLVLTITAVEAIRAGSSEEQASEQKYFRRLNLTELGRQPIDFLALPPQSAATLGILIATGQIDEGAYDRIRLRFDPNTAHITLSEPFTVDGAILTAGAHPLVITTGAQLGVQVGGPEFIITENGSAGIELVFDAVQTLASVRIRGDTVLLKPYFRPGRITP